MASAVRRTRNGNGVGVEPKSMMVDDLADDAAQIGELDMDVRQVDLAPRLAETTRRVAQHGVPIGDQQLGDVAEVVLVPTPTVHQHDEWTQLSTPRQHDRYVEQSTVHRAREESGTHATVLPRSATVQSRARDTSAREEAGSARVGSEVVWWRRAFVLCLQRHVACRRGQLRPHLIRFARDDQEREREYSRFHSRTPSVGTRSHGACRPARRGRWRDAGEANYATWAGFENSPASARSPWRHARTFSLPSAAAQWALCWAIGSAPGMPVSRPWSRSRQGPNTAITSKPTAQKVTARRTMRRRSRR